MRRLGLFLPLLSLGLSLAACSSDATSEKAPYVPEPLPPAEAFQAGVAFMKMPIPVGIGTMGYGGIGKGESITPFAEMFPGTTGQQTALNCRAVALSRGSAYRSVLVKCDTVGMFQHMREHVLNIVEQNTGQDLDDALVIAGNHTHSGPGRMIKPRAIFDMLADLFHAEIYENMVHELADLVVRAMDDMRPAELATLVTEVDAHDDRRCENDPLDQVQRRDDMPIVAIRREGQIDALVMTYAYHGTLLDMEDLTLSGDVGSVVEAKVEERFDHPVSVLFFNSWGGDAAPGKSKIPADAVGAEQPSKYDHMESLGTQIADAVMPLVPNLQFTGEPELRSETYRVPIDRDLLGYAEEEFPFPNGGAYCGMASDGSCDAIEPKEGIDRFCLAFSDDQPAPKQSLFTVGRIGNLYFTTGMGEWSTYLADQFMKHMAAETGSETMFIGYANDYQGYCLTEQDWWQGGYETAGGMWGPRQGDYVLARGMEIFDHFFHRDAPLPFEEPDPVEPFSGYTVEPYQPESGISVGTIQADVPAAAGQQDVVSFAVLGTDPWLGAPVAVLEKQTASGFEPVLRPNGTEVDSEGYELWLHLSVNPAYADVMPAAEREFVWTFSFPVSHKVPASFGKLEGTYRFRIEIPMESGDTKKVETGTFSVSP
jgi:neutral ceramidase